MVEDVHCFFVVIDESESSLIIGSKLSYFLSFLARSSKAWSSKKRVPGHKPLGFLKQCRPQPKDFLCFSSLILTF